uniref:Uncharacterized protein n=1 Tax=Anopheles darlingi TaxID=43151 RepID=A0A2M4D865_ANODA
MLFCFFFFFFVYLCIVYGGSALPSIIFFTGYFSLSLARARALYTPPPLPLSLFLCFTPAFMKHNFIS